METNVKLSCLSCIPVLISPFFLLLFLSISPLFYLVFHLPLICSSLHFCGIPFCACHLFKI
jgi:hypothetical protein